MKKRIAILGSIIGLPVVGFWVLAQGGNYAPYSGSSFNEVWDSLTTATPTNRIYSGADLPQYTVTMGTLVSGARAIAKAAIDTLQDESDLWPYRQLKAIRPNGICLAGKWKITAEKTGYTGYFAPGAEGLVVARASVGFDETKKGSLRAFGMGIKLFPTQDPSEVVRTANLLLIDDNAGTMTEHFTDAVLLNEPRLTPLNLITDAATRRSLLGKASILSTVKRAQSEADGNSGIRQVYPVSRAGLADVRDAVTPALMKVIGSPESEPRESPADFREDLRVSNYANGLHFDILVAAERRADADWKSIGKLSFDRDVVSDDCDERLHFLHAKWIPGQR